MVNGAIPYPQHSSCGQRNDDTRPPDGFSALSLLQCTDSAGWMTMVGAIYFIPNVFSETNGERQREVGKQSRLITHVLCVKGSGHTYW